MRADQVLCSLAYAGNIQRRMKPADAAVIATRSHSMIEQHITVNACLRRKSRMKILMHGMRPGHGYGWRQQRIHATHPCTQRTVNSTVKMHHLPQRMHAGVGTSGADCAHRYTGNAGAGRFQTILDRARSSLRLPAAESAAVILDA